MNRTFFVKKCFLKIFRPVHTSQFSNHDLIVSLHVFLQLDGKLLEYMELICLCLYLEYLTHSRHSVHVLEIDSCFLVFPVVQTLVPSHPLEYHFSITRIICCSGCCSVPPRNTFGTEVLIHTEQLGPLWELPCIEESCLI